MTPEERARQAWKAWGEGVTDEWGFAHEVAGYLDADGTGLLAAISREISAAVAEEREACARLAKAHERGQECGYRCGDYIAEAIRARAHPAEGGRP